jgi:hypothetical protein
MSEGRSYVQHWVQLENIVSTSLLLQQVWLVDTVGDLVEK